MPASFGPFADAAQAAARMSARPAGGLGRSLESQAAMQQLAMQKRLSNMLFGGGKKKKGGGNIFDDLLGGISGIGGGGSSGTPSSPGFPDIGMGTVPPPGYSTGTGLGMPIQSTSIGQPGFQENAPVSGTTQPGFAETQPGSPALGMPIYQTGGAGAQNPTQIYGQGRRNALAQQYADIGRSATANLEARGLGGSTLTGPTLSGVQRQQNLAMNELDDQLFREQLQFRTAERAPLFGILQSLLGGMFGAIS